MKYIKDSVENINIAYIGGGSTEWAWKVMSDLALEENLSGTIKLFDINYEAAYANEIIGNKLLKRNEVKGKWKYKAVKSLKETILNADIVFISILPGTFQEMKSDVHLPEKYGIYQSVGDSVGPGGIVRALRAIPMFIEFARAIKEYCPEAWIINYTNPMSVLVRTLYKVFPEIKAFGCCHEVFGTQKLLAMMLKEMRGINGINREEIKVNILGINHFTWINRASYKGINLIPLYSEFVDKYYEDGYEQSKKGHWMNDYFSSAELVKFDLFRRFGLIAAAGDRHLAEFVPGTWYLKDPETVKRWKFSLTPVDWRIEHKKELKKKSRRLVNGEEEFELKPSGEEGVKQIKALLGLGDLITNVNIPNIGQINNLPNKVIVETNAVFRRDRIEPVIAGKLPEELLNLVITHVLNQETILKAVLNKNKELAFRGFLNDPQITRLDINDARDLFIKMLENVKEYLIFKKLKL